MSSRKKSDQVRFVNKPSDRKTKIIVCITIALSLVVLLVLHVATENARKEDEAWRNEAQVQEQEKSRLEELLSKLGTLEGMKELAENFLGLTDPDTIVIQPEN